MKDQQWANRSLLRIKTTLLILCIVLGYTQSFVLLKGASRQSPSLFLVDDADQDVLFGSSKMDTVKSTTDETSFLTSLKDRQRELKNGIGKRYVARTQKGFLNVHHEPSDPFANENIVAQLTEGQIVTSTGPSRGFWIPHDGGGWSVSKYQGFTWLEPIDE